jgi:TRAP-type C4-dicarboxylate transport system permease small subunit
VHAIPPCFRLPSHGRRDPVQRPPAPSPGHVDTRIRFAQAPAARGAPETSRPDRQGETPMAEPNGPGAWPALARVEGAIVRLIEAILVLLLAGMVAMVFTNVVLRYVFNLNLPFSEEMSRYFFVWLTFVGAVLTFREHGHIGVEAMVRLFGRRGRLVLMLVTNAIIVFCMVVLFLGTWRQHPINATMFAPISRLPMIWVFGIAYFTAIGIAFIALVRILRILTGRMSEAEVRHFAGEYDEVEIASRST